MRTAFKKRTKSVQQTLLDLPYFCIKRHLEHNRNLWHFFFVESLQNPTKIALPACLSVCCLSIFYVRTVKIAQWTFLVITTGELNIYPEFSIWLTSNILDAIQEGLQHTQTSFFQTNVNPLTPELNPSA
jgi:hypothetical protein